MLTFGPDGLTGHPDHRTVSAWTGAAFAAAAPGARLLHATIAQRRAVGRADDELGIYPPGLPGPHAATRTWPSTSCWTRRRRARRRALAAQATQTGGLIATLGLDTYTAWVGAESFVESARRVLDVVERR